MKVGFDSRKEPLTLVIVVKTKGQSGHKIRIRVRDWKKPNTYYTNRYATIKGTGKFYVRMPQSPEKAVIEIYNEKNGDVPQGKDPSFSLVSIKAEPLKTKMDCFSSKNGATKDFIQFAQQFSERAGTISSGHSVYQSDDGKFRIDYIDAFTDSKGNVVPRVARISAERGVITVAKKYFITYTVPMRMATLLHEYSHFYINANAASETEADLNALLIYLSMGYPRVEAHQAFTEIFKKMDTPENRKRYEVLSNFIDNFENENVKFKLCA